MLQTVWEVILRIFEYDSQNSYWKLDKQSLILILLINFSKQSLHMILLINLSLRFLNEMFGFSNYAKDTTHII